MATKYKRVSRKQRQEVYQSLRAALIDVDNARIGYKSGHSDGSVAQQHGLSITDIENLRCQLVEEVMADIIATCQVSIPRLAAHVAALEEKVRRFEEFAEDSDVPNVLLH